MKKILSMVALTLLSAVNLSAAGTTAGTSIVNNASLSFSVGGVKQTDVTSNDDTFVVDRKIDFLLENKDAEQILVVPGSTDQITTWSITNEGNLAQKFAFTAAQLTGGETVYSDADTQDSTGLIVEYDNAGTWTVLTTLEIAVDATISLRIKTDINIARVDGDVMNISLTAKAIDASGNLETNTAGADNKAVEDTVLAEGAGATGDIKENGIFVAWGGYIIAAPNLSLSKTSCVLTDPINLTSNPKRIPGATVLYILDISNTGTSTDATDVNVSDDLAGTLDYASMANLKQDDGQTACSCTDGVAYATGSTIANSGTTPLIKLTGLTVTKAKHNCISFEVDIL